MPDDEYRLLLSDYWVSTSKDLTYSEAQNLIKKLEAKAIAAGVWSDYSKRGKLRYEDVKGRRGMGSPKQLRMIEAMWREVSYAGSEIERKWTLKAFLRRIVGFSNMRDLDSSHTRKIIKAIQSMKAKSAKNIDSHRNTEEIWGIDTQERRQGNGRCSSKS
jgi:hypothetical protein